MDIKKIFVGKYCPAKGSVSSAGFTLLECLVVVAIVGVVTSLALPSYAQFIDREKISALSDEFAKTVTVARSAAIKSGVPVVLCASSNGDACTADWSAGWMAFVDNDRDGIAHADENVLARRTNSSNSVQVNVNDLSGDGVNAVRFNYRGAPNSPLAVTVTKGGQISSIAVTSFGQPRRND